MLKYVRIKPVFRIVSDLCLTEYKGATLGGMFKTALRRTCCTRSHAIGSHTGCKQCDYAGECIFTEITEKKSISGENTSLPYIISCSCLQSNFYEAGDSISFEIIIIGKAIKHLADILASLTYWSELDIRNFPQLVSENEIKLRGQPKEWPADIRPRGRLKLEQIEEISAKGPRLLYASNLTLQVPEGGFVNLEPGLEPGQQAETWQVMITFLSPLRILQKRKRITPQTFNPELFFGRLADRYNNFSRHFGTGAPDKNEPDYIKRKNASKSVVCLHNTLKTRQIKRYKNHLNNYVPLDGLLGEVVFDNVNNSLLPLIKTGELLHAGKSITFGYGEYKTEYFAQV